LKFILPTGLIRTQSTDPKYFFSLLGIASVSDESINTAREILKMKEEHVAIVNHGVRNPANGLKLIKRMFDHPINIIKKVEELLDVSYPISN
jgi:hypothetical protein